MLLLTLTRLIVLGYIALAVFSLLEVRQLLNGSDNDGGGYSLESEDGGTFRVPLLLCIPSKLILVEGDRSTIIISTASTTAASDCRELDYLVNACASSLLLSAVAALFWFVCDMTARCRRRSDGSGLGPLNKHTAAGMGLFLIFMLLQAGVSTGALVGQTKELVRSYESLLDQFRSAPPPEAAAAGSSNSTTTTTTTTGGSETESATTLPPMMNATTNTSSSSGEDIVVVNGTSRFLHEDDSTINTQEWASDIDTVKAYASTAFLTITSIYAFATCLILLIDAMVYSCLYKPRKAMHTAHLQDVQSANFIMEQQAKAVAAVTQSSTPYSTTANGGSGISSYYNYDTPTPTSAPPTGLPFTTPTLSGSSSASSSSPMGGMTPPPPSASAPQNTPGAVADPFPNWTAY
jgi:hypothetical protein